MREPFPIGDVEVAPGTRRSLRLPVAQSYAGGDVHLPVRVVHGRTEGPCLFVCAAVHGDEINGVEIIRRLLARRELRRLSGTLIAVPIVNVFGFAQQSRYLPDRRDLNRSFPGSATGSLAARLAHVFMTEVVAKATHGIDLHTASNHRANLPQVRGCLDDPETEKLARAFGVPVILNANLRDGSLRQEVLERGVPMLVYEAGEALRFEEKPIRAGVRGILRVMRSLEMLPASRHASRPPPEPFLARGSYWVRSPASGILRVHSQLGDRVKADEELGVVSDPLGEDASPLLAPRAGVVIGMTQLPLANEGDALFHVATFERPAAVADLVESFHADLEEPYRA